jgi:hypothetical protein
VASPSSPDPPRSHAGAHSLRWRGYEPWAWVSFGVGALALVLFIVLGSKPGGPLAVKAYLLGIPLIGLSAAIVLLTGLVWSLWKRPVLQPGRVAPLLVSGSALWICSFPLAYPSSHANRPSTTTFRLPFEGEWTCVWGGETRETNRHVLMPWARYGFEFTRGTEFGANQETVGATVLAPAAGTVARVPIDGRTGLASIVLKVGSDEWLTLSGLDPAGMVQVEGAEVATGDLLARVGQARTSEPPALVLWLADRPDQGEGIPMRFFGYESATGRVDAGVPQGGVAGRKLLGERVRAPAPPR